MRRTSYEPARLNTPVVSVHGGTTKVLPAHLVGIVRPWAMAHCMNIEDFLWAVRELPPGAKIRHPQTDRILAEREEIIRWLVDPPRRLQPA
jgi:hypothetical protein